VPVGAWPTCAMNEAALTAMTVGKQFADTTRQQDIAVHWLGPPTDWVRLSWVENWKNGPMDSLRQTNEQEMVSLMTFLARVVRRRYFQGPPVRMSVCPSQWWSTPKRFKISKCISRLTIEWSACSFFTPWCTVVSSLRRSVFKKATLSK